jgi:hypothetical protein
MYHRREGCPETGLQLVVSRSADSNRIHLPLSCCRNDTRSEAA